MFKKIITTAVQCFIICLTAEAIRQAWKEERRQKEAASENKEERK